MFEAWTPFQTALLVSLLALWTYFNLAGADKNLGIGDYQDIVGNKKNLQYNHVHHFHHSPPKDDHVQFRKFKLGTGMIIDEAGLFNEFEQKKKDGFGFGLRGGKFRKKNGWFVVDGPKPLHHHDQHHHHHDDHDDGKHHLHHHHDDHHDDHHDEGTKVEEVQKDLGILPSDQFNFGENAAAFQEQLMQFDKQAAAGGQNPFGGMFQDPAMQFAKQVEQENPFSMFKDQLMKQTEAGEMNEFAMLNTPPPPVKMTKAAGEHHETLDLDGQQDHHGLHHHDHHQKEIEVHHHHHGFGQGHIGHNHPTGDHQGGGGGGGGLGGLKGGVWTGSGFTYPLGKHGWRRMFKQLLFGMILQAPH